MYEVIRHRKKTIQKMLTGNEAAAYAAMNSKVRFVAAYPITPATPVMETISKLVYEGKMQAHFVNVESEHSAMAACIGASAGGVRAFTATSSHGLAYMHEMLHWASNARTPIVMAVANRAIGPGWNIWADLSDSLSQRDAGWMQFYCSSIQEIYDTIPMAYKVAESKKVLIPAMVCYDGFVLSHTSTAVELTPLDGFIDEYEAYWKIDLDSPLTHGNIMLPEHYSSLRMSIHNAHKRAIDEMFKVEQEFLEFCGRYTPLVYESYKIDDAEKVIVAMGAIASEAKIAVDKLRDRGLKVGLLRLKSFRPFPKEIVKKLLQNKDVYVLDRSLSPGIGGILHQEISAVLCRDIKSTVLGLGGVDVTAESIERKILKGGDNDGN